MCRKLSRNWLLILALVMGYFTLRCLRSFGSSKSFCFDSDDSRRLYFSAPIIHTAVQGSTWTSSVYFNEKEVSFGVPFPRTGLQGVCTKDLVCRLQQFKNVNVFLYCVGLWSFFFLFSILRLSFFTFRFFYLIAFFLPCLSPICSS